MDMQRIIERVKKMLALAADKGASQGERDNAMSAVHKYLAQYNLDMETVNGAKSHTERKKEQAAEAEGGPRTSHEHSFFGRPWACNAAISIAELCFCGYLYRAGRVSKDSHHYFVGRQANAVTAAYLSEFVVNSIHSEGRRRQRAMNEPNPWFISFAWGASLEVQARVRQLMKDSAGQRGSGTDLVLLDIYDKEKEANREFTKVAFPKTRIMKSRGKGISRGDAYDEGKKYGGTINLNRQIN